MSKLGLCFIIRKIESGKLNSLAPITKGFIWLVNEAAHYANKIKAGIACGLRGCGRLCRALRPRHGVETDGGRRVRGVGRGLWGAGCGVRGEGMEAGGRRGRGFVCLSEA